MSQRRAGPVIGGVVALMILLSARVGALPEVPTVAPAPTGNGPSAGERSLLFLKIPDVLPKADRARPGEGGPVVKPRAGRVRYHSRGWAGAGEEKPVRAVRDS
eukprot:CAMPEP_0182879466 /NCGR_PEP_ID=MMETSP0034_2-20130328/15995_1 /TAXON_ID=156128 /ORGANISM="Nephroselmis pyriformis, Strain CCMP717" /LENGTH=102 /DNA_ID=CAMNT_0025012409 /DNA_START=29 /DNA_END=334 /DNA_ORIENTATION=-